MDQNLATSIFVLAAHVPDEVLDTRLAVLPGERWV